MCRFLYTNLPNKRQYKRVVPFARSQKSQHSIFPHFIYLHSDWIWRDTSYLSVLSPNTGKCRPEKLRIWTLFTQCFKHQIISGDIKRDFFLLISILDYLWKYLVYIGFFCTGIPALIGCALENSCSKIFYKSRRKASVPESFINKVKGLQVAILFKKSLAQVYSCHEKLFYRITLRH